MKGRLTSSRRTATIFKKTVIDLADPALLQNHLPQAEMVNPLGVHSREAIVDVEVNEVAVDVVVVVVVAQ